MALNMNKTLQPKRSAASMRLGCQAALLVSLTLTALPGLAQTAGSWQWKLGINTIRPSVSGGALTAPSLPNTLLDVRPASSLIASATYFYTDHFSVEAFAGLPYEHDVVGAGSVAGAGKLGTVKQVSPTVMAQYRLGGPQATLRPYLGLGVSYAYFYGEKGSGALTALTNPGSTATRLSVDAAWGVTAQLGATIQIGKGWQLDAAVLKTQLKTTARLSTGQTSSPRLDPLAANLSIGRAF
jgi:outer membrane protein